ncbi:hypothetical protein JHL18_15035 [Clostridium sp. YIM B02505]|uniref:Uncharacterized protein n=1 Tax=Clostridium yunnanense TaxID=2800325 RepID=A0ABS1ERI0_9CLOT|nr:hypothetical protein [Clostridium yunnanense]MBK1811934.1 hypothetical protein [Clostridium yunnanense]
MKIEYVTKSIELVNDEKLYLINMELWNILERDNEIDGIPMEENLLKSLSKMASFVRKHKGFSLTFYRYSIGTTRYRWLFCIVYNINDRLQRVQIENVTCEFCGWKGKMANPTIPSLYDTVEDRQEALNIAWNMPVVNCPVCDKKLKRNAIWVGYI